MCPRSNWSLSSGLFPISPLISMYSASACVSESWISCLKPRMLVPGVLLLSYALRDLGFILPIVSLALRRISASCRSRVLFGSVSPNREWLGCNGSRQTLSRPASTRASSSSSSSSISSSSSLSSTSSIVTCAVSYPHLNMHVHIHIYNVCKQVHGKRAWFCTRHKARPATTACMKAE